MKIKVDLSGKQIFSLHFLNFLFSDDCRFPRSYRRWYREPVYLPPSAVQSWYLAWLYHHPEADIHAVCGVYADCPIFTCKHLWAHLVLCSFVTRVDSCDQDLNQDTGSFTTGSLVLPFLATATCLPLPLPDSWPSLISPSLTFSFWECAVDGVVQYAAFWERMFPLSMMPLRRAIQVTVCILRGLFVCLFFILWLSSLPWCGCSPVF